MSLIPFALQKHTSHFPHETVVYSCTNDWDLLIHKHIIFVEEQQYSDSLLTQFLLTSAHCSMALPAYFFTNETILDPKFVGY